MKRHGLFTLGQGFMFAVATTLGACGGPQTMTAHGTEVAPATMADIRIGKTEGAQTVVVDARHLAPPDRLGAGLSQYAVWIIPAGMEPILAGTLAYDREQRTGRLQATTPFEVFEVVVTAEGDGIARAPRGPVVLRKSSQEP